MKVIEAAGAGPRRRCAAGVAAAGASPRAAGIALLVLGATASGLGWADFAGGMPKTLPDPTTVFDLRIDAVEIHGATLVENAAGKGPAGVNRLHVERGRTIGIACKWSAHLAGSWTYAEVTPAQQLQYVIKVDGATIAVGPATIPAGTRLGSKTTDTSGFKVPTTEDPSVYQGSSTTSHFPKHYAGVTGATKWTAEKSGLHDVRCEIAGPGLKDAAVANNFKAVALQVDVPAVSAGSTPAAAATASPQAYGGALPRSTTSRMSDQKADATVSSPPAAGGAFAAPPPVPAGTGSTPAPQPTRQAATKGTPNWGAAAGQASGGAPAPASGALAMSGPGTMKAPAASDLGRDLAAASCSAPGGALRFVCATRAGYDRCEALRRERKVEQCTLAERR